MYQHPVDLTDVNDKIDGVESNLTADAITDRVEDNEMT